MKFRLIIILFLLNSCAQNYTSIKTKKPFTSKGFAYIYNDQDFTNKLIKRKLNNNLLEIAHNKLKPGSFIKIINVKTNDTIILKNNKRFDYPDFYKILITESVADKLNLKSDFPIVEIIEVKKNKSFIAKKTKIFKEEEQIHNKAPVESVTVANISKNTMGTKKVNTDDFYIIIGEFYSKNSAIILKKRISKELVNFDRNKLLISSNNSKKSTLLSGPYNSINLMKNDYIQLKKFGFEELDISINENK